MINYHLIGLPAKLMFIEIKRAMNGSNYLETVSIIHNARIAAFCDLFHNLTRVHETISKFADDLEMQTVVGE